MTAEIAILNRSGVALAADSMATSHGIAKNYPTAKKIMPLSIDPPIAAMIYGSDSLGPYPWDTIVQLYTTNRKGIRYETVEECALDFMGYLDNIAEAMSPNAQLRYIRSEIFRELDEINHIAMRNYALAMAPDERDASVGVDLFIGQVDNHLTERLTQLETIGASPGLTPDVMAQALIDALADWHFDGESVRDWRHMLELWLASREEFAFVNPSALANHLDERLRNAVLVSLATADWSGASTGVVISGLGDAQMLPALEHWLVDGVVANVVKSRRLSHTEIGDDCTSTIIPFAQTDAMKALVDGIHEDITRSVMIGVRQSLNELVEQVGESLGSSSLSEDAKEALADSLRSEAYSIGGEFAGRMAAARRTYANQFLQIVASLPQEHLADMAEALVNVAAFKERFTPGTDSVGGPIDVVLLSKAHGLVWASRKQ